MLLQPAHRRRSAAGETLRAERLFELLFVIPERSTKLVFVTLEAKLFSEFAVLIFQFRGSLFQLAETVYNFINVLFGFPILEGFPELVLREATASIASMTAPIPFTSLESTVRTPAEKASSDSCGVANIVYISTAHSGARALIARAASSPFITGIA
jgi:hypothetical protein